MEHDKEGRICICFFVLFKSDSVNFDRLTICVALLLCLVSLGCGPNLKAIPTPLHDPVEQVLEGRIRRIWGGDNFEFGEAFELHYILIRGVDTPKPGQPFYNEAREFLTKSVRGKTARLEIVGRDELMCEFADVFVLPKNEGDLEKDMGLELIKAGLGWYDGMEFDKADEYREAEKEARFKRAGLWVQENPVAPWEFEEAH